MSWTIYAVDDGCPHGSGALAQRIALDHDSGSQVKVLFLEIQSSEDLDKLIGHLPDELAEAADDQLGNPEVMSVAALRSWIRERKAAS